MSDVPFPLLTFPGQAPQVAGGRLINCYPEQLPSTAGKPYAYWRVAGLSQWGTAPSGAYRGSIVVGSTFYAIFGTTVYKYTNAGGAGTALPGTVSGTGFCWLAVNQNTPPDIAVVSPGVAVYVITDPGGVLNYPDANAGGADCVVYIAGMFIFTFLNGKAIASNVNTTAINPLNYAFAQTKADALYRPIPLANSQLLLCGQNTVEVWGSPVNPTGFPFTYQTTIYRGIASVSAICGSEDGWGYGVYFVGDDSKVSTFSGYQPTPISTPDLDQLIEKEPDKSKIIVGCYVSRGHGMVVVSGPSWCWEFDVVASSWHERQSYLQTYWRGLQPLSVFGNWLCGDVAGPNILQISGTTRYELGLPLRMRIETGAIGAFPQKVRINGIELYVTKGAGIAGGHDPDETNPMVEISISRDGGQSWSNPRAVFIGRQSTTDMRARAAVWGQCDIQGVRWRFDQSAGLNFAMMGADMQVDVLR